MGFPDARPVVRPHAEDGGPAGRPARAVDARHLRGLDAEIVAEGRGGRLRGPQLGLLDHREAGDVVQAPELVRRDARLLPLPPVEGAPLPRVADLAGELGEDERVAGGRVRALDLGQPVGRVRRGPVGGVVPRRPYRQVDAATAAERGQVERGHPISRRVAPPPGRGCASRWSRAACPAGAPRRRPSRAAAARPRPGSPRPRPGGCQARRPLA